MIGGAVCVGCGERELGFLTIDHVNNDGFVGGRMSHLYREVIAGRCPAALQCLCSNCNMGKLRNLGKLVDSATVWLCCTASNAKCIHGPHSRLVQLKRNDRLVAVETLSRYSDNPHCNCCDESNMLFLTLDHINSDGAQERRQAMTTGGPKFYRYLAKRGYPTGYQVLCANCNCGRARNGGICPHHQTYWPAK